MALLPAANALQPYVSGIGLTLSLVVLVTILAGRGRKGDTASATAEVVRPAPVLVHASQADAEIVSFLAMLQAKGRLVDFLMDDINVHDDAQVGAAARVVHAGCKAALEEHFRIRPVREESEGSTVQVAAGYRADEYRLIGKISGVTQAEDVTGPYDVIVRAQAGDVDELGRLVAAHIQSVPGITRTLTCPVVHI
jgi:DNA-binding Lrp family transcriptional regulator